jgi:hypothetical protein
MEGQMSQSSYPVGAPAEGAVTKDWLSPRALRLLAAGMAMCFVLVCALQLGTSVRATQADGRLETLAGLSAKVSALAYGLESERDDTIWFIARSARPDGVRSKTMSAAARSELQTVRQQYADTDKWVGRVEAGLSAIGTGYPARVVLAARSAAAEVSFLASVRRAAMSPGTAALDVLERYTSVINVLLALENEIGPNSSDSQVMATVSAMSQVSRIQQEFSIQRGLIVYGLTAGSFAPNMLRSLQASIADQYSDIDQFENFASTRQMQDFQTALGSDSYADRFRALEQTVSHYAQSHASMTGLGVAPDEWFGNSTELMSKTRSVELRLNAEVTQHAESLQRSAVTTTAIFSAVIVLLMAVILWLLRPFITTRWRRHRA